MYTDFLKTLALISEKLDEVAKMGSDGPGLPTPYLAGSVDVLLEGEKVGSFQFEDEWVIYVPKEKDQ